VTFSKIRGARPSSFSASVTLRAVSAVFTASIHPLILYLLRMWRLILLFLLICRASGEEQSAFSVPTSELNECFTPIRDNCTFYMLCLEDKYHCGPDGYPLGYGQHFCQKFAAEISSFSPKGRQWISNTMLCLQDSLVPEATTTTSGVNNCDSLKEVALSKHAKCYVESGLCSLSPFDWLRIVRTVGIKPLVTSFEGFLQAVEAAGLCVGQYTILAGVAGIIFVIGVFIRVL
jgi:hypothetical protein